MLSDFPEADSWLSNRLANCVNVTIHSYHIGQNKPFLFIFVPE